MTQTTKPKRKLSDIDFSREDAHIALVSKTQGGPANGADYALVMKASNRSPEFIEKVQQITVTMELPDFLEKFFYIWGEDADILATMMGYVEPVETAQMENEEAASELESWVKERFVSFEIIKSLKTSENLIKSISELTDDEFLQLRKDQKELEKSLVEVEKVKAAGISSTANSKQKEIQMTKQVEMIEKGQLVAVEKALSETQELLKAAQAQLEAFETEKKEAIRKSRFDAVKTAVGDEKVAETVFKAVGLVQDQAEFEEVVKALSDMKALIEKSAMFEEVGASAQESAPTEEESGVTKLLKQQFVQK